MIMGYVVVRLVEALHYKSEIVGLFSYGVMGLFFGLIHLAAL
jgi:hypothetical protein